MPTADYSAVTQRATDAAGLGGDGGIFAGVNPYVLAGQALFSIYNGYRQREELEKQRAEATAIHVARPGQTAVVPLCYGRFKSKATPVDVATSGRYTAPGAAPDIVFKAQRYLIPGGDGGEDRRSATGAATAGLDRSFALTGGGGVPFLTTRWSGPVGPIHKVWWIKLNGVDHDFARWCSGQRIHVRLNGGADPLASGNGIPAQSRLTGRVAVTGVFRNTLLKPYGEQRIPFDLDLYGEGKLVRTIVDDGSGNLSLSAVRVYSNNSILVAIDYMTDPVNGWGMPDSLIDLATAKAAADICDTFVDTLPGNINFAFNRRGSVWRRPGEWNDAVPPYIRREHTSGGIVLARVDRTNGSGGQAAVPPAGAQYAWYTQSGRLVEFNPAVPTQAQWVADGVRASDGINGMVGIDNGLSGSAWPPQVSKNPAHANGPAATAASRLRLYECNIEMDTTRTLRRNLFDVFNTVSGLRVYWWDGKINFALVNPTTKAEEDALVAATHTDSEIVGDVATSVPERISAHATDFQDEAKDFEAGKAVWPEPGSADETMVRNLLGSVPNERSGTYPGVSTIHHANALSEYEVRTRLRAVEHSYEIHRSEWRTNRVLPGKLVDLSSTRNGIPATRCIVDTATIGSTRVRITAVKYDYRDGAWNRNQPIDQAYGGALDAVDEVPAPETVTATLDPLSRQFLISWTLPADEPKTQFADIEQRIDGGSWLRIAGVVQGDVLTFPWPADDAGGRYEFGVRQRRSDNAVSAPTRSAEISVAPFLDDGGGVNEPGCPTELKHLLQDVGGAGAAIPAATTCRAGPRSRSRRRTGCAGCSSGTRRTRRCGNRRTRRRGRRTCTPICRPCPAAAGPYAGSTSGSTRTRCCTATRAATTSGRDR